MRINDKNLIVFAMSKTPVDRDGWLLKRGEVNKNFQKRWFVLKGNLLFYSEKPDREPVGLIILEGCTIELAESDDRFSFKIVFHGTGHRMYILSADTHECMEGWMKALACASYDCMKCTVAELEKQLADLTDAERESRLAASKPLVDAVGITVNRSDSCLTSPPRFNPFDRRGLITLGSTTDSAAHASSFTILHDAYGRRIKQAFDVYSTKGASGSGAAQTGLLVDLS